MIYNSLLDIADNFDTFFFDAWGVFNFGKDLSENAIAVMAELVSRGKTVSIISNTPRNSVGVIEQFAKKGLIRGVHYNEFFSSGQLCWSLAQEGKLPVPGKRYYDAWECNLLPPPLNLFANSDYIKVESIQDADFIFCNFPSYNGSLVTDDSLLEPEINKLLKSKLPIICPNPDKRTILDGISYVMQGTPCKTLEDRGAKVIYYGKPYPEIFVDAMFRLGDFDKKRTVMIGDTLETDILGATRAGITACLTLEKGISADDMLNSGLKLTRDNIDKEAEKIGTHVDYIIQKVPRLDI